MDDSEEEGVSAFALQLLTAYVLPTVLSSAIELDLLELIKKAGHLSPSQLAAQIPTTNPEAPALLNRILRFLAANGILECTLPHGGVERLYSLSPVCKYFTRNEDGASLAPLLLLVQDKVIVDFWYHLKDTVIEGGVPFNRAHGMSALEYLAMDTRLNKVFNQAMYGYSTIFMKRVLEIYKGFEGLQSLVDVGGGTGASLNMIVSKYPSIKGINLDLPHVIQHAPSLPGVEHVNGDMFVGVPKGDAIFMKWISHDWGDEKLLKVLKNCHEAIGSDGKVIIAERLISEIPKKDLQTSIDMTFDLLMLASFHGGKERTQMELQTLAKASGFNLFRKVCCCFGFWIIELYK